MHGILVLKLVQDGIGIGKYIGPAWVIGERHRG
jgi:hypothetical protein